MDESGTQNHHYAGRVRLASDGDDYIGMAQAIEYDNCVSLRGKNVIFQFKAKTGYNVNIRAAIIEWTGVKDQINFGTLSKRDPINDWNNTSYTAGNFFKNTSLTVTAVSPSLVTTTNYADYTLTGAVSNNCNNLIVLVWIESANSGPNHYLQLAEVGLYKGSSAVEWEPRSIAQELILCQRYYEKSYDLDVKQGTASANGFVQFICPVLGTNYIQAFCSYKVIKRINPTVWIFDDAGNGGSTLRCNRGSVNKVCYIARPNSSSFIIHCIDTTSAQGIGFHFVAQCEI
jgi:hypothetical protein